MNDTKGADTDYWQAYDMEQKMRKEKEQGKIITGKGAVESTASETENPDDGDKKTREKSDKSIEKFSRLVVYDKEEEIRSSYKNEIRGRVQDRQVRVDLQPQFVISYYEKTEDIDQGAARYNKLISDYNAQMTLKLQLKAINNEAPLTDPQAEFHFQSIDDYSLAIDRNAEYTDAYFGRALDFMVLQDLSEAIDDYTRVIHLNPDFVLAYFNRAVVRYKQMEIENYQGGENREMNEMSLNIKRKNDKTYQSATSNTYKPIDKNPQQTMASESKLTYEYEQILRDYATVIQLNPDFVYAYFNRGNIRCSQKDFRAALTDYNEAVSRNPDFAEAYYNRGLTRLYLGDTEKGIADLSKAGELGIADAYSIIKKMTMD
jgi:tetratricopeptide (TPR) repeat protein